MQLPCGILNTTSALLCQSLWQSRREGWREVDRGREESFNLPELERPQTQTRHAGLGPVSNNDFLHLSTN